VLSIGSGNTRYYAEVTVEIDGRPHVFISIHKDKDLGDGVSIDRSDDTANEFSGLVSVMGDFNLWPDDPIMKKMPKKLTDSADHVDMPGSREEKKSANLMALTTPIRAVALMRSGLILVFTKFLLRILWIRPIETPPITTALRFEF
jgi:hypothetical protein